MIYLESQELLLECARMPGVAALVCTLVVPGVVAQVCTPEEFRCVSDFVSPISSFQSQKELGTSSVGRCVDEPL